SFAAEQSDRRLSEVNVAEADIHQRLQFLSDLRNVFQNGEGVGDGHLEQVGDGISVVLYGERLMIVTASAADFALHVDVGEKIHLDAALAFAVAGLRAAAGNVERKPAALVAAFARRRQHGVEVANLSEDSGVGGGI